jgi:hypothetical protein
VSSQFYITKGQKTVGPCSLDDLRSFVAYGSIKETDLIRREGQSDWTPLRHLEELTPKEGDPPTSRDVGIPRRTARYRDYEKVPSVRQAGWVLTRVIWGFLLFPPLLWKATLAIYQQTIYTREKNEHGYLLTWPRWVESVVTVLLLVNAAAWIAAIWWTSARAAPLAHDLIAMFHTALTDLQDWLGR